MAIWVKQLGAEPFYKEKRLSLSKDTEDLEARPDSLTHLCVREIPSGIEESWEPALGLAKDVLPIVHHRSLSTTILAARPIFPPTEAT